MMTCAYNSIYLGRIAHAVGNMLHNAIVEFCMDGPDFLDRFIRSGVAGEIESGNLKYVARKNALALFLEVMEKTTDYHYNATLKESSIRCPVYWIGWILTHYQWYSGRTFKSILDTISYEELLELYGPLHNFGLQRGYEALDAYFAVSESRLKMIRRRCRLTQQALANEAGVSLNTVRAYERKGRDLSKAQPDIVAQLAKALHCEVAELLA